MKRKDRHTAGDAWIVRHYCIGMVRELSRFTRRYGNDRRIEAEKAGLLHILRMMRDRRNGKQ
jgi:hypothetical protein